MKARFLSVDHPLDIRAQAYQVSQLQVLTRSAYRYLHRPRMADLFTQAAAQVHVAIGSLGVSAVHEGARVDLPELAVRVEVIDAEVRESSAIVVYDIASRDAQYGGIQVLAVGLGDTAAQAFADAAFQWTTGVFTVVRHWLAPEQHTCFTSDVYMQVRDDDTYEEFAWRVHLGPVLSRAWGDAAARSSEGLDPHAVMRSLFEVVHPRAAHRQLFWIEAYVVRYDNGTIDSTCRLRNEDWDEGRDALIRWASTWKVAANAMISARQFLLFEPVAIDEVPRGYDLRRALAKTSRVPWWKRLFARH